LIPNTKPAARPAAGGGLTLYFDKLMNPTREDELI
jgi:hypothetical protein